MDAKRHSVEINTSNDDHDHDSGNYSARDRADMRKTIAQSIGGNRSTTRARKEYDPTSLQLPSSPSTIKREAQAQGKETYDPAAPALSGLSKKARAVVSSSRTSEICKSQGRIQRGLHITNRFAICCSETRAATLCCLSPLPLAYFIESEHCSLQIAVKLPPSSHATILCCKKPDKAQKRARLLSAMFSHCLKTALLLQYVKDATDGAVNCTRRGSN